MASSLLRRQMSRLALRAPSAVASCPQRIAAFSSNADSFVLPSNIKMEEGLDVFNEEFKMNIDPMEMLFPPLSVDASTQIRQFGNPGQFCSEQAILDPTVFGVAIRQDIVHEVVRYQRHLFRQPNKTKRSFEISGSTKKPYKQKGMGRAQAGNSRASHRRGGQKAHGPVLRSYAIGMTRKSRAMGLMITLAAKYREGSLLVFDNFDLENHRTKDFHDILGAHGLADNRLVMIDESISDNLELASRNMHTVLPLLQAKANVYDILKREKLLITTASLSHLQERLVEQYTHTGGMKSYLKGLDQMENHPGFELLKNRQ